MTVAKLRNLICCGGPWDGQAYKSRIPIGQNTMVIHAKGFYGYYTVRSASMAWTSLKPTNGS